MLGKKNWQFVAATATATIMFLFGELAKLAKCEKTEKTGDVGISWLVELQPYDQHYQTDRFRFKREGNKERIGNKEEIPPKIMSFHVHSDIKYRYSRTIVTSKLENPEGNFWSQELQFRVVLPETAFISQFSIELDGKHYRGKVLRKQEASQKYQHAKRGHRTAGLVELNPRFSNVFMVNVNVEPQGSIIFHLAYEELLRRKLGLYEQLININPGQATFAPIPDHKISVNIEDTRDLVNVSASKVCDNVKMGKETGDVAIRESNTKASISWIVSTEEQRKLDETGISCQLEVHYDVERINKDEAGGGEILISQGYFVHFFSQDDLSPIPQHLIFILDISMSMRGEKMEQMKEAQIQILSEMRETDYFSIIIFDNVAELWTPAKSCKGQPLRATPENLEKARAYVGTLKERGATNIHAALMEGLDRANFIAEAHVAPECSGKLPSNDVKPLIIFLTDGQPNKGITNLDEILETTRKKNRDINVSILSLGFGKDVDFPFLKKLSLQNHGFARKIYEGADAALQIRNFYREVCSLLLTDVKFRYTTIGTSDISDLTETKFSEYFGGTDIVVAGKLDSRDFCGSADASLKNLEKFKANVTGGGDGAMKWLDIPANLVGPTDCGQPNPWNAELATPDDKFLEALWAYLTIRQLLDNEATGIGPSAMGNKKALELSLKYGFVTPLTSLLVVTPERSPSPQQHTEMQIVVNDDDGSRRNPPGDAFDFNFNTNYHDTSFSSVATTKIERHLIIFIAFFSVVLSQY